MTANTWQVYSGGRVIAYFAVGIIQNVVPSYQAEIAPAGLRGFYSGTMHLMTGMGNLWGSGMGRAYANEQGPRGYLICTGIQFAVGGSSPYEFKADSWNSQQSFCLSLYRSVLVNARTTALTDIHQNRPVGSS